MNGGPIEAAYQRRDRARHEGHSAVMNGGPIEATALFAAFTSGAFHSAVMNGGPIEAFLAPDDLCPLDGQATPP